jgi:hypothetical protein
MITRRDFIKGMGALALIPFVPGMLKPEPPRLTVEYTRPDGTQAIFDYTGEMTIPHDGERYKVRYTVHPDSTEAEIVGEE